MSLILLDWTSENQNIIKINGYKVIQLIVKHIVHEPLKRGRCIAEAKGENNKFIKSPKFLKSTSIGIFGSMAS